MFFVLYTTNSIATSRSLSERRGGRGSRRVAMPSNNPNPAHLSVFYYLDWTATARRGYSPYLLVVALAAGRRKHSALHKSRKPMRKPRPGESLRDRSHGSGVRRNVYRLAEPRPGYLHRRLSLILHSAPHPDLKEPPHIACRRVRRARDRGGRSSRSALPGVECSRFY